MKWLDLFGSSADADAQNTQRVERNASVLTPFIPSCVTELLEKNGPTTDPIAEPFWGAVLLADMSGFTAITERMDTLGVRGMEEMNNYLNLLFTPMISIIEEHGGDVLKFAGDALLVLWKVESPSSEDSGVLYGDMQAHSTASEAECYAHELIVSRLQEALVKACMCALTLVYRLDKMSPLPGAMFRVHCAVASGPLYGLHVGGHRNSWEFLVHGSPLEKLGRCIDLAAKGEVVLCPSSKELLSARKGALKFSLTPMDDGYTLLDWHFAHQPMRAFPISDVMSSFPRKSLRTATVSEPSSVSPKYIDGIRSYLPPLLLSRLDAHQGKWLSEIRNASVLFVKLPDFDTVSDPSETKTPVLSRSNSRGSSAGSPPPLAFWDQIRSPWSPGSPSSPPSRDHPGFQSSQLLRNLGWLITPHIHSHLVAFNRIVRQAQEVIERKGGIVRQLLADDKGTVLIAVFGLQSRHQVAPSCVEAALELSSVAGMKSSPMSMGITSGRVYVGLVGCRTRHEYAVMGSVVNTAARLMVMCGQEKPSSLYNHRGRQFSEQGGILCDDTTFSQIMRSRECHHSFQPVALARLKGVQKPVQCYAPLGAWQGSRAHTRESFIELHRSTVGRKAQLLSLQHALSQTANTSIAVFVGPVGSGRKHLLNAGVALSLGLGQLPLVIRGNSRESEQQLLLRVLMVFCAYWNSSGSALHVAPTLLDLEQSISAKLIHSAMPLAVQSARDPVLAMFFHRAAKTIPKMPLSLYASMRLSATQLFSPILPLHMKRSRAVELAGCFVRLLVGAGVLPGSEGESGPTCPGFQSFSEEPENGAIISAIAALTVLLFPRDPNVTIFVNETLWDNDPLLQAIIDVAQLCPVRVVTSTKAGEETLAQPLNRMSRAFDKTTVINVDPFTAEEVAKLITYRLNARAIDARLLDVVHQYTLGHAAAVEELVFALSSGDILEKDENGVCKIRDSKSLRTLVSPSQILQDTYESQIDTVKPLMQLLLKIASVIGPVVDLPSILSVFPRDLHFKPSMAHLQTLCSIGILVPDPPQLPESTTANDSDGSNSFNSPDHAPCSPTTVSPKGFQRVGYAPKSLSRKRHGRALRRGTKSLSDLNSQLVIGGMKAGVLMGGGGCPVRTPTATPVTISPSDTPSSSAAASPDGLGKRPPHGHVSAPPSPPRQPTVAPLLQTGPSDLSSNLNHRASSMSSWPDPLTLGRNILRRLAFEADATLSPPSTPAAPLSPARTSPNFPCTQRFRFRIESVRRACYDRLAPSQRAQLHSRLAAMCELTLSRSEDGSVWGLSAASSCTAAAPSVRGDGEANLVESFEDIHSMHVGKRPTGRVWLRAARHWKSAAFHHRTTENDHVKGMLAFAAVRAFLAAAMELLREQELEEMVEAMENAWTLLRTGSLLGFFNSLCQGQKIALLRSRSDSETAGGGALRLFRHPPYLSVLARRSSSATAVEQASCLSRESSANSTTSASGPQTPSSDIVVKELVAASCAHVTSWSLPSLFALWGPDPTDAYVLSHAVHSCYELQPKQCTMCAVQLTWGSLLHSFTVPVAIRRSQDLRRIRLQRRKDRRLAVQVVTLFALLPDSGTSVAGLSRQTSLNPSATASETDDCPVSTDANGPFLSLWEQWKSVDVDVDKDVSLPATEYPDDESTANFCANTANTSAGVSSGLPKPTLTKRLTPPSPQRLTRRITPPSPRLVRRVSPPSLVRRLSPPSPMLAKGASPSSPVLGRGASGGSITGIHSPTPVRKVTPPSPLPMVESGVGPRVPFSLAQRRVKAASSHFTGNEHGGNAVVETEPPVVQTESKLGAPATLPPKSRTAPAEYRLARVRLEGETRVRSLSDGMVHGARGAAARNLMFMNKEACEVHIPGQGCIDVFRRENSDPQECRLNLRGLFSDEKGARPPVPAEPRKHPTPSGSAGDASLRRSPRMHRSRCSSMNETKTSLSSLSSSGTEKIEEGSESSSSGAANRETGRKRRKRHRRVKSGSARIPPVTISSPSIRDGSSLNRSASTAGPGQQRSRRNHSFDSEGSGPSIGSSEKSGASSAGSRQALLQVLSGEPCGAVLSNSRIEMRDRRVPKLQSPQGPRRVHSEPPQASVSSQKIGTHAQGSCLRTSNIEDSTEEVSNCRECPAVMAAPLLCIPRIKESDKNNGLNSLAATFGDRNPHYSTSAFNTPSSLFVLERTGTDGSQALSQYDVETTDCLPLMSACSSVKDVGSGSSERSAVDSPRGSRSTCRRKNPAARYEGSTGSDPECLGIRYPVGGLTASNSPEGTSEDSGSGRDVSKSRLRKNQNLFRKLSQTSEEDLSTVPTTAACWKRDKGEDPPEVILARKLSRHTSSADSGDGGPSIHSEEDSSGVDASKSPKRRRRKRQSLIKKLSHTSDESPLPASSSPEHWPATPLGENLVSTPQFDEMTFGEVQTVQPIQRILASDALSTGPPGVTSALLSEVDVHPTSSGHFEEGPVMLQRSLTRERPSLPATRLDLPGSTASRLRSSSSRIPRSSSGLYRSSSAFMTPAFSPLGSPLSESQYVPPFDIDAPLAFPNPPPTTVCPSCYPFIAPSCYVGIALAVHSPLGTTADTAEMLSHALTVFNATPDLEMLENPVNFSRAGSLCLPHMHNRPVTPATPATHTQPQRRISKSPASPASPRSPRSPAAGLFSSHNFSCSSGSGGSSPAATSASPEIVSSAEDEKWMEAARMRASKILFDSSPMSIFFSVVEPGRYTNDMCLLSNAVNLWKLFLYYANFQPPPPLSSSPKSTDANPFSWVSTTTGKARVLLPRQPDPEELKSGTNGSRLFLKYHYEASHPCGSSFLQDSKDATSSEDTEEAICFSSFNDVYGAMRTVQMRAFLRLPLDSNLDDFLARIPNTHGALRHWLDMLCPQLALCSLLERLRVHCAASGVTSLEEVPSLHWRRHNQTLLFTAIMTTKIQGLDLETDRKLLAGSLGSYELGMTDNVPGSASENCGACTGGWDFDGTSGWFFLWALCQTSLYLHDLRLGQYLVVRWRKISLTTGSVFLLPECFRFSAEFAFLELLDMVASSTYSIEELTNQACTVYSHGLAAWILAAEQGVPLFRVRALLLLRRLMQLRLPYPTKRLRRPIDEGVTSDLDYAAKLNNARDDSAAATLTPSLENKVPEEVESAKDDCITEAATTQAPRRTHSPPTAVDATLTSPEIPQVTGSPSSSTSGGPSILSPCSRTRAGTVMSPAMAAAAVDVRRTESASSMSSSIPMVDERSLECEEDGPPRLPVCHFLLAQSSPDQLLPSAKFLAGFYVPSGYPLVHCMRASWSNFTQVDYSGMIHEYRSRWTEFPSRDSSYLAEFEP